jgi:hypothetical protein
VLKAPDLQIFCILSVLVISVVKRKGRFKISIWCYLQGRLQKLIPWDGWDGWDGWKPVGMGLYHLSLCTKEIGE